MYARVLHKQYASSGLMTGSATKDIHVFPISKPWSIDGQSSDASHCQLNTKSYGHGA